MSPEYEIDQIIEDQIDLWTEEKRRWEVLLKQAEQLEFEEEEI